MTMTKPKKFKACKTYPLCLLQKYGAEAISCTFPGETEKTSVQEAITNLAGNTSKVLTNSHVMYSTDGGTTMTDDASGATHVGIIKDLSAVGDEALTVADYVWIPLS